MILRERGEHSEVEVRRAEFRARPVGVIESRERLLRQLAQALRDLHRRPFSAQVSSDGVLDVAGDLFIPRIAAPARCALP